MLEIAKAISYRSKLIIMDEPTSAITEHDCQKLFRIINDLKQKGVSFIYITHKMDEVFQICDYVTVMRDGKFVAYKPIQETTQNDLIRLMVGRELTDIYPKQKVEIGEPILEVKGLTYNGVFENVSFKAHRGEILGVAGLMGAGRTEIIETIFGVRTASAGDIYIKGKKVEIRSPRDAIKNRISFLTEDRRKDGIYGVVSIYQNMMILSYKTYAGIFVNDKKGKALCQEQIDRYRIKMRSPKQPISELSGGNQQKALLARWLSNDPDIILFDEPTRGIDVGAKHEIYAEMTRLAKAGKVIIMISSEMPEILGMSDRIMVIHEGKVACILDRSEANQEVILRYAAGLGSDES